MRHPVPAPCNTWKVKYTLPAFTGTGAIGNVDWCDAYAFCAYAGKRLCGGIGGGELNLSSSLSLQSEWQYACTHGGDPNYQYPYGPTVKPDVCLYNDSPSSSHSRPVAQNPQCVGPAGIFDLSGNVWEWENACDRSPSLPDGASNAQCNLRGGGFLRVSSAWGACTKVPGGWTRGSFTDDTGIRCCADFK